MRLAPCWEKTYRFLEIIGTVVSTLEYTRTRGKCRLPISMEHTRNLLIIEAEVSKDFPVVLTSLTLLTIAISSNLHQDISKNIPLLFIGKRWHQKI